MSRLSFHHEAPVSPRPISAQARTILDIFEDNARVLAERTALRHVDGDGWRAISWRDYHEQVHAVAAALAEMGIEPGDRVGIISHNRPEWHVADLAVSCIGAVSVPLYPTSAASQVAYMLRHAEARVCFAESLDQLAKILLRRHELPKLERVVLFNPPDGLDDSYLSTLAEMLDQGRTLIGRDADLVGRRLRAIDAGDLATLVYTSGTTGPPKGTMLTHANIMSAVRSITAAVPITPADRFLSFLPLSHIAERTVSHTGHIVSGGETWFARSLATVAEDLKQCRPTVFLAVPRVWEKFHEAVLEVIHSEHGPKRAMIDRYLELADAHVRDTQDGTPMSAVDRLAYAGLDRVVGGTIRSNLGLDKARVLVCTAAPVHPDLLRWFHGIGLPISEVYGQTEDCGPTSINPFDDIRIGTVGKAFPGVTVRIADDGEILVQGGNVCAGYYKDDQATAELIDTDGWMHSGDLGSLDADGYLSISGRKKDLIINSAGKNIAPQVIETQLRHEPLISQAVVVGDARPYLVALLTLDGEQVRMWAAERGKLSQLEVLSDDPELLAAVGAAVDRVNAEHARVEQIKRWRVLAHDFTMAAGELTSTLKVKRNVVRDHYRGVIDELYAAS